VPTGVGLRRRCGTAETSLAGSCCSGSLWASARGAAGQCAAHGPRVHPHTHEKAAPGPRHDPGRGAPRPWPATRASIPTRSASSNPVRERTGGREMESRKSQQRPAPDSFFS
jgi:hypothetical protein